MTADIYEVVARRIREQRLKAGLSIEQLAEAAGIGTSFLSYIETLGRKPSLATVGKLAGALGIPVAELFAGTTAKKEEKDYRLVRQMVSVVKDKTPEQQEALLSTLKAVAKSLGRTKKDGRR